MGWLKRESAYDRRIRELEEEADRVRKSMQQLVKGARRDTGTRVETVTAAAPREASSFQRPPAYRKTADFRRPAEPAPEPALDDQASLPESVLSSTQPSAAGKPERLASFLASGSFGKSGSLSRERKIQRNKAIVMMILAAIALYSLYVWLK